MAVTLSIKSVPQEWAERLRQRAERNHRSLQGELMALVERAVSEAVPVAVAREPVAAARTMAQRRGSLSVDETAERIRQRRAAGMVMPADLPRAVEIIRSDRDSR